MLLGGGRDKTGRCLVCKLGHHPRPQWQDANLQRGGAGGEGPMGMACGRTLESLGAWNCDCVGSLHIRRAGLSTWQRMMLPMGNC